MPAQCPECGRFLAKAFVAGLGHDPTPCPRCEAPLAAAQVRGQEPASSAPSATGDSHSVRPPDLVPDTVREDDVLDGWDRGADVVDLAHFRADRPPFPVDAAVVGCGLALGAVVGALTAQRPGRGAALGALVGMLAGATARQVWRLE